jgi:beta-fructofuranosidase
MHQSLVCNSQDICVSFNILKSDAHSFGMLLQADDNGKAFKLQIAPAESGRYTVSLLTDLPPLDDFWADQYKLYLPRPVDGPELVRHDSLDLRDGVVVLLKGQTVQAFCGGRSISFRLPAQKPHGVFAPAAPFGWFVEDGNVQLANLAIRYASDKSAV